MTTRASAEVSRWCQTSSVRGERGYSGGTGGENNVGCTKLLLVVLQAHGRNIKTRLCRDIRSPLR
eukprot:7895542-Alexandrium_andersonii.AAC.1